MDSLERQVVEDVRKTAQTFGETFIIFHLQTALAKKFMRQGHSREEAVKMVNKATELREGAIF